jgi:plastocyanin
MRRAVVAALLGLVVLAAPANSAFVVKAKTNADGDEVFRPKTANVMRGTKVTWKAVSGLHDVTSISKNWSKGSVIAAGQTTSFTFNKAGTYRYQCTFHSVYNPVTKVCTGMCGRVVVG